MNTPTPATRHAVDTARAVLAHLGLTPHDLLELPSNAPTFACAVPKLRPTLTTRTLSTYNTHLRNLETLWAERPLDEPTTAELTQLAQHAQTHSRTQRGTRNGASAREHFVSAVRCLYRYAEHNKWIHPHNNPARALTIPARTPSHRHAIPPQYLQQICDTAATTGNDPALDSLLLRLHTETACRRQGALRLRPDDLDPQHCLVLLREKGDHRWQPVSATLMNHLIRHGTRRGSTPGTPLLRFGNKQPLTARRYDNLWSRLAAHLPWVAAQQVTTHWLRHTTLTWVERHYGYATARAYAGHTTHRPGTTATYVKADIHEIATALATLTQEPHPLALSDHHA
ncbi:tyrosine-type recombinase/integrase [Nocardia salmonicida]